MGSGLLFAISFGLTALMTWLPGFVAPLNLLAGAAVGTLDVVLWERWHGTQTVEIEVPRIPDHTPVDVHRSGQVDEEAATEPQAATQ